MLDLPILIKDYVSILVAFLDGLKRSEKVDMVNGIL